MTFKDTCINVCFVHTQELHKMFLTYENLFKLKT